MKMQTVLLAGLAAGLTIGVGQWAGAGASIMPSRLQGTMIPMTSENVMPMAKPSMAKTAKTPMAAKTSMAKGAGMVKVLMAGNFVKAEHPTMGGASVVMKDGKPYLMFDQKFKSDNGPDLFVLLHREATPKNYAAADYVSLGRLKQLTGTQMYEIPAGMDVAEYQSAVIWCKEFNATFGFAMLK